MAKTGLTNTKNRNISEFDIQNDCKSYFVILALHKSNLIVINEEARQPIRCPFMARLLRCH